MSSTDNARSVSIGVSNRIEVEVEGSEEGVKKDPNAPLDPPPRRWSAFGLVGFVFATLGLTFLTMSVNMKAWKDVDIGADNPTYHHNPFRCWDDDEILCKKWEKAVIAFMVFAILKSYSGFMLLILFMFTDPWHCYPLISGVLFALAGVSGDFSCGIYAYKVEGEVLVGFIFAIIGANCLLLGGVIILIHELNRHYKLWYFYIQ